MFLRLRSCRQALATLVALCLMHSRRIQLFLSMVVIILSPSQALACLEWGLQNTDQVDQPRSHQ